MKASAILASNTSSIMLEQLDDRLPDPSRLVGLHFFNPVAQMPLVEIVCGENSSEESIQKAIAFTRKIDKLPLPCKSAPGFLVNRVLVPYLYEAMFALQDGVPIEVIDEAALRYGMPMGPVELADVVGLDVCKHVGDIVSKALNKQTTRYFAHRSTDRREETRTQDRRRFLRLARRQGRQIEGPARRTAGRSRRSPGARARQRVRSSLARGNRRRRGSHRRRRDLRLGFRAVPRRSAHLRAQTRCRRSRCTPRRTHQKVRISLHARRRMDFLAHRPLSRRSGVLAFPHVPKSVKSA